jgi:hypothetical protein
MSLIQGPYPFVADIDMKRLEHWVVTQKNYYFEQYEIQKRRQDDKKANFQFRLYQRMAEIEKLVGLVYTRGLGGYGGGMDA